MELQRSDIQSLDESYDPYEHRTPEKPLSDFRALTNLLKSAIGTGLFAMPNAFASVGLIVGMIGTTLMGLLITVSLHMLLKAHHKMCTLLRRPKLDYDQVVVATILSSIRKPCLSSRVATYGIDAMILICYVGISAVQVVFVSGTIQESVDPSGTIDQGYYSLMLLPLFCLINMVKYLSDIAIISMIGNALLFMAAAVGVIYALKDGIGEKWETVAPDVILYPKFFGAVFFSMCSPGIILAIEHDMKKPENYTKYCGILNQGMIHITLLHAFVGAIGYLKWGDASLGNFIRNHPANDPVTILTLLMQAFAIYFTYGIQCYMPIYIVYNDYIVPALSQQAGKATPFLWDVAVRMLVTIVTCSLAALVPKVDLFIGLVGAVCISTLTTLVPATLYILINRDSPGKYRWRMIIGILLFIIGAIVASCATVISVMLIADFCRTRYGHERSFCSA